MKNLQDLVCEFNKANKFPINSLLLDKNGPAKRPLWVLWYVKTIGYLLLILGRISMWVDKLATKLGCRDPRIFRCHIMVDELGETLVAISNNDEIEVADGLADLAYVLVGTAILHNIPLETVFREVHRSNLTKGFIPGQDGRIKGLYRSAEYSPPDIEAAIIVGRQRKDGGTVALPGKNLGRLIWDDLKGKQDVVDN